MQKYISCLSHSRVCSYVFTVMLANRTEKRSDTSTECYQVPRNTFKPVSSNFRSCSSVFTPTRFWSLMCVWFENPRLEQGTTFAVNWPSVVQHDAEKVEDSPLFRSPRLQSFSRLRQGRGKPPLQFEWNRTTPAGHVFANVSYSKRIFRSLSLLQTKSISPR